MQPLISHIYNCHDNPFSHAFGLLLLQQPLHMQVYGCHNSLCLYNYKLSKKPYTLKFLWVSQQPLFEYFLAIIIVFTHVNLWLSHQPLIIYFQAIKTDLHTQIYRCHNYISSLHIQVSKSHIYTFFTPHTTYQHAFYIYNFFL